MNDETSGWSEYFLVTNFMGSESERNRFLYISDDTDPAKYCVLHELWWEPVEKHNTSEIASLAQLKRATSFKHGPDGRGSGLTLERIERVKSTIPEDGAFRIETTTLPATFEQIESILSGVPRVSRARWAWKQFWHRDPHAIRDEDGLVWHCHGAPNRLRLERESRAFQLLNAIRKCCKPLQIFLQWFGWTVDFTTGWPEPTTNFSLYFADGRMQAWTRKLRVWRLGIYRLVENRGPKK